MSLERLKERLLALGTEAIHWRPPMARSWLGSASVLTSAVCYGFLPIFVSFAYAGGASATQLLFARFVLAFAMLALFLSVTGGLRIPPRRYLVTLILLGGVGYFIQSALYFSALLYAPISVVVLVLYTYPAFVTLASSALGVERVSGRLVLTLAVALLGLFLVAGPLLGPSPLGIALSLGASLVYTCYILVGNHVIKGVGGELSSFFIFGGSAVSFGALCLATGTLSFPWGTETWSWVIMISLISTVMALTLFFRGLRLVGPSRTSILSTAELATSVVMAAIIFDEALLPSQILGGALVLSAAVLAAVPPKSNVGPG